MSAPQYSNPGTKAQLDEAREQWHEQSREGEVGINALDALEAAGARQAVSQEDQPGVDLPEPDVKTAEWRGSELPFDELGDAPVTLAKMREDPDVGDAEINDYVYTLLEEKCRHDAADEAYWRRFDIMGDDGVLDLFLRLTGEEGGIPDDLEEAAQKFRDE